MLKYLPRSIRKSTRFIHTMTPTLNLSNKNLYQPSLFINNEFVPASGEDFDVLDPATGQTWATLASATAADAERAVDAAHDAFHGSAWRSLTARERARLLLEWDRLIRANKADLAQLLVFETGKPLREAEGEVDYALTFCWWMAGEAERQHGSIANGNGPGPSANNRFLVTKYPIGVVATLTPWNFPIALFLRKAATALAAGCTVVNKPSPETPLSANALAYLAREAGFPPGTINILPCNEANTPLIGSALCTHAKVQKVSFTGSTPVGKKLAAQCASSLKKLTLELGGNGPFIIFNDADLDHAVAQLMLCKFRHAGQTCVCAQRVFVQSDIYDKVVDLLTARMQEDLTPGHGLDPATTLGPLTTPRSLDKAHAHVSDAVSRGAKAITPVAAPNSSVSSAGYFFPPTLLLNASDTMAVASEESFAPIVSLFRFDTESEVLARANDTAMGLTSYVFTSNADRIWRVMETIETGNVGINVGLTTSAEAPFGGWHDSGYGKEAGMGYGIAEYLKVKTATWSVNWKAE